MRWTSRGIFRAGAIMMILLLSTLLIAPKPEVLADGDSFSFGMVADIGGSSDQQAVLNAIATNGTAFTVALGDLSYDNKQPETEWCKFVQYTDYDDPPDDPFHNTILRFGTLNYPFELVAGNHDITLGSGSFIDNFALCLPDRLNSQGVYGRNYYFDYPAANPLARVILISPGQDVFGLATYNFEMGGIQYNWVSDSIDAARSAGIPWVVVGMHEDCLSMGVKPCEIGQDLLNLLLDKQVDLILQGHDHDYQRSKQLRCAAIDTYYAPCVVSGSATTNFNKGSGSIITISGTGGGVPDLINASDTEAPYFLEDMGSNPTTETYGFVKVTVTAGLLTVQFVPANTPETSGFTDSYTIVDNGAGTQSRMIPTTLTDDATIKQASANTNFGSGNNLLVKASNPPSGNNQEDILLKFTVPPTDRQIDHVMLRLYTLDDTTAGGSIFKTATSSWVQGSVNWNSAPATTGSVLGNFGALSDMGAWYQVEIPATAIAADGTVSLRMTTSTTTEMSYGSQELGPRKPQLLVWGTPIAPPSNLHLSPPALRTHVPMAWNDNSNNETGFRVDRSPAGQNSWTTLTTTASNVTSYTDNTTTCATSYDYRVMATNVAGNVTTAATASGVTSMACEPNPPSVPNPTHGATDVSLTPSLSWTENDPETTGFTYDVSIGTSNPPSNEVCDEVATTSCNPGTLNPNTVYFWQVTASNGSGHETDGPVWSFTTLNRVPNAPVASSPANGATGVSLAPTLSWTGSDPDPGDTLTYDVFFGTTNPPTGSPICNDVTATTCPLSGLAVLTTYYWKVTATDNHGLSTSTISSFVTHPPVPEVSLNPTSLSFGSMLSSATSAGKTVTVTNSGGAALNVGTITPSAGFAITNNTCTTPVASGGQCTFDVTFTPGTPGAKTGTVQVPSNAASSPDTINVSGAGLTSRAAPVLRTPKNNFAVYKKQVKLVWKTVKGVSGYHLEISSSNLFNTPPVQTGDPTKSNFLTKALSYGVYFWHVASKDPLGQGVYSAPLSFEVTLNKTPKKNVKVANGLVKFKWLAVAGKTYILEVYKDAQLTIPALITPPLTASKYSIPKGSALPKGQYWWLVRVAGVPTPAWKFTVP